MPYHILSPVNCTEVSQVETVIQQVEPSLCLGALCTTKQHTQSRPGLRATYFMGSSHPPLQSSLPKVLALQQHTGSPSIFLMMMMVMNQLVGIFTKVQHWWNMSFLGQLGQNCTKKMGQYFDKNWDNFTKIETIFEKISITHWGENPLFIQKFPRIWYLKNVNFVKIKNSKMWIL